MRSAPRSSLFIAAAVLLPTLVLAGCGDKYAGPTDVVVVTEDGFRLAATEYGKGENGVVLAHDSDSDKGQLAEFAAFLAAEGMKIVAVNFRGYPGSDGVRDAQVMDRDLVGAAKFLIRDRGVKKIAYIGVGSGGTVAYRAAANPDLQPAALVAISAPVKYQALDASKSVIQLFMPKMLVDSEDDKAALEQVRDTFKMLPEPKQLEEVPGTLRATALLNAPSSENLRKSIADYVKRAFA